MLGLFAGGLGAGIGLMIVRDFPPAAGVAATVGFGISVVSLLFLSLGMSVPVTHHMTLIGGLAAVSFLPVVNGNMIAALLIGAILGMVAACLGRVLCALLAQSRRHPNRPTGLCYLVDDHPGSRVGRGVVLAWLPAEFGGAFPQDEVRFDEP
jgi:hypothetical protein